MAESIHEVLRGHPDPRALPIGEFMKAIGAPDVPQWRDAADCMAGHVACAAAENRTMTARRATRDLLAKIANQAKELAAHTGNEAVIEALRVFAPFDGRGPGDVEGYEYLTALVARCERAAASIREGQGADGLSSALGRPPPKLLCATMTRAAFKVVHGRSPGENLTAALEACSALWRAAGGEAMGNEAENPGGAWIRHLRAARGKGATDAQAAALVSARLTARDCLALLQQE